MPKTIPLSDFYHQEALRGLSEALKRLQFYFTQRDSRLVDACMDELFPDEGNILVVSAGNDDWCKSISEVKEQFVTDWEYWGDVVFDLDSAVIDYQNDIGWIAVCGTVSKADDTEISFRSEQDNNAGSDSESPLISLLMQASHRLDGEPVHFSRTPVRLTAVLTKSTDRWLFRQMHFAVTL